MHDAEITQGRINVLLSGNFSADQVERIRNVHHTLNVYGEEGGIAIVPPEGLDAMELTYPRFRPEVDIDTILLTAEVIVASRLPRDIRKRAPRLRWVQYLGAGIDHLLTREELLKAEFTITNASGIHAIPLAETALSMMLGLTRSWRIFDDQQRRHVWERHLLGELHGATLGVLALGRVGRQVAAVGKATGMHVIGSGPTLSGGNPAEYGVDELLPRARWRDLLSRSDFLVCCAPLTPETLHMLGESEFQAMRPSAYFINIGRGQIVDESALVRALQEGWIAGAGLDVFETEPLPADSLLWDMSNVIILPHQGSDTAKIMNRATQLVVENLRRYVAGEPLLNVVDPLKGY
jgi:D-2-hydroxyacid dehydrogenase (NADP+)